MFKIGEKVVCVKIDAVCKLSGRINPHPQLHEICKIREIYENILGITAVSFNEYGEHLVYELDNFRKLDHTFAEEVTARIEEEINQENLVGA